MKRYSDFYIFFTVAFVIMLFLGCNSADVAQPKPRAYFKINYPKKEYQLFTKAPFQFEVPSYAVMELDKDRNALPYWYNMHFKQFNGKLHLSYYPIDNQKELFQLTEDARKLVFKHTIKASAIEQAFISLPAHNVYGIIYTLDGEAASWVQFYLTDSTHHYLRGALYFNEVPKLDSIKPVLQFIKKDIDTLINTLKWEKLKN